MGKISNKHWIPHVLQQPYCTPNPTAQAKASILDSFFIDNRKFFLPLIKPNWSRPVLDQYAAKSIAVVHV